MNQKGNSLFGHSRKKPKTKNFVWMEGVIFENEKRPNIFDLPVELLSEVGC